ncbi:MAG: hypothetical protein ACYC1U_06835 [Candidatus Aquicultorales bacterium]
MTDLALQQLALAGLNPTFAAADVAGNTFTNTGGEFLVVKNGSGVSIDVTVDSIKPCDQGVDHNAVVSVPAGQERWIGRFDPARFTNPATGKVSVTYSAVATVTVAAIKV